MDHWSSLSYCVVFPGTTLFLLFANDLPFSIKHFSADFFTDDSTFHITGIESKLQVYSHEANKRGVYVITCQKIKTKPLV